MKADKISDIETIRDEGDMLINSSDVEIIQLRPPEVIEISSDSMV